MSGPAGRYHTTTMRYTGYKTYIWSSAMPASTPIAHTKTAALARILDSVPKGYHRYTSGKVKATKAESLIQKFHALYGIGCTPMQRLTRKGKGQANVLLAVYWPEGAEMVDWLLLATDGNGLEKESLSKAEDKPRLTWLGYELFRYAAKGKTVWTWRRPKQEMTELFKYVTYQARNRQYNALKETLERIARQPGFHGVRTQSWALCEEALRCGYDGQLPHLFYLEKVSHGERFALD